MVRIKVENSRYEACMKYDDHPHKDLPCSKDCPDWHECQLGEFVMADAYLVIDADSIKELLEIQRKLLEQGYKVRIDVRERW